MRYALACAALLLSVEAAWAAEGAGAAPVRVVAAENFYGDVAQQVGGDAVTVSSILSNPDQDPHLFEASPSVARDLAHAAIAVENGVDYDPWMSKLIGAASARGITVIDMARLTGHKAGDNPHLWYDPATMPAFAHALTTAVVARDPAAKDAVVARLAAFDASLAPIRAHIAAIRARYAGIQVTATEPVFGYMAAALGFEMRNMRFQIAVMNDAEPSASDQAAMEDDLRNHRVRVFFYNSQATDSAAQRLLAIAHAASVPVVGVTETEPAGKDYQRWMESELDAIDRALAAPAH